MCSRRSIIPAAGDWEVRFEYRPAHWTEVWLAALAGALLLAGVGLATEIRYRRRIPRDRALAISRIELWLVKTSGSLIEVQQPETDPVPQRATLSTNRRRLFALATLGLILLMALVAITSSRGRSSGAWRTLEVEMRASAGSLSQLYWARELSFDEQHSARLPLQPGLEGFQRLRFQLPSEGVRWLRFHPTDASGQVVIRRMELLDWHGHRLKTFGAESLTPASQIASIGRQGDVTTLVTTPAADNPSRLCGAGMCGSRIFAGPTVAGHTGDARTGKRRRCRAARRLHPRHWSCRWRRQGEHRSTSRGRRVADRGAVDVDSLPRECFRPSFS